MEAKEKWHLDKRVPITIIIVLTIQTMGFLTGAGWYIGKDQEWKKNIEVRLSYIPRKIPPDKVVERLNSLENSMNLIKNNQKHIIIRLDAVAERLNAVP